MYIEINHSKLGTCANAIDDYISFMKKHMDLSTDKVNKLVSNKWKHADALEFQNRWLKNLDSTSATSRMRASLQNYASSLRYAEGQYKEAQARAINKANSLY